MACREQSTGAPDAAKPPPPVDAALVPVEAPKKTEFALGPNITLQLERYLPIEYLGHGSWAAFSPRGERAIVGAPGRASFMPGDRELKGKEPTNGAFSSDGKTFFLLRPGANAVTNEVDVHATSDLHRIAKLENALDPKWVNDALVFHRGGQVFRLDSSPNAEPKLVGPASPAFKDRPKAITYAPSLDSMVVFDGATVRRIALTRAGRDAPLITSDIVAKFSKLPMPVVAIAPGGERVCIMGVASGLTAVWCASDDTAPEQITSYGKSKVFDASFLSANLLWYQVPTSGAVGIANFETRTVSAMMIPGATTTTDLTPLPGGRRAVARDFFRLGIVDMADKKFIPLGDDKASPKAVAGLGADDAAFAVTGSSMDAGIGLFGVKIR